MNWFKFIIICMIVGALTYLVLELASNAISRSKNSVEIANLSIWNKDDLPPFLQDAPDKVTASVEPYHEQNSWFKLTHTGDETVSIPIFEVPLSSINHCKLEYSAQMKTADVKNKVYLEMLCFVNGTPYFSRGINNSLNGTSEEYRLDIPFYLDQDDYPEKLHLGVRIEGPGTVWIRGMKVEKRGPSIFEQKAFIRYSWLGAFLGIMGGIYGTVAGICVPKSKGKNIVKNLGYFLITFCTISLLLGILAILSGEKYSIWYPLIHTGVLGLVIFIPIHIITLRNYQKNELQRMKAMDSLDSLS